MPAKAGPLQGQPINAPHALFVSDLVHYNDSSKWGFWKVVGVSGRDVNGGPHKG